MGSHGAISPFSGRSCGSLIPCGRSFPIGSHGAIGISPFSGRSYASLIPHGGPFSTGSHGVIRSFSEGSYGNFIGAFSRGSSGTFSVDCFVFSRPVVWRVLSSPTARFRLGQTQLRPQFYSARKRAGVVRIERDDLRSEIQIITI
jgi:hypothetical protein